jgi:hypothetical protein
MMVAFLCGVKAEEKTLPNPDNFLIFQKDKPLHLKNVRGKGILMIFCQWHAAWSGPMLKQVEQKYKDNPNFLLVIIKNKCSSMTDANIYFKDLGLDPKAWIMGYDKTGAYMNAVVGDNKIWPYILVNTKGKIVEIGTSGTYRTGTNPRKFLIALDDKSALCGNLTSLIPQGKYPEEFSNIIDLAEIGAYADALKKIDSKRKKSKLKELLKELRNDICEILGQSVDEDLKKLKNSELDFTERYEKYIKIEKLLKDLKKEKFSKKALIALKKFSKQPQFAKEKAAEKEYTRIMKKYGQNYDHFSSRDRGKRQKALMKLVKKYPNTKYAKVATDDLGR